MISSLPKNKQLILFDGVCNLCNASVLYVIKDDKNNRFMFAPLQSEIGQQIVDFFNVDSSKTDSILLYSEQKGISTKSNAALKIAMHLGFPRNLMAVFFVVPPFLRDWIYDFVAKNRYKWYGKKDECMIPTPELREKFL